MASKGQKVTTDAESNRHPIYEGGFVTKDSLAGESIRDGGSYGADNPHTAVSDQPSNSTNTNNTDISGADTLPPAANSTSRSAQFSHQTFEKGRVDPYTHKTAEETDESPSYSGRQYNSKERAGTQDSSTEPQISTKDTGSESAFDEGAPNASFNQEIGGPNDPGRVGEAKFIEHNEAYPRGSGRPRDNEMDSDSPFKDLKEEPAPDSNPVSNESTSQPRKGHTGQSSKSSDGPTTSGVPNSVLSSTQGTRPAPSNESTEHPHKHHAEKSSSSSDGPTSSGIPDSVLSETQGTRPPPQDDSEGSGVTHSKRHDKSESAYPEGRYAPKPHDPTATNEYRDSTTEDESRTKKEIVEERQQQLELPDQPPQPSDWQSLDARNVNL